MVTGMKSTPNCLCGENDWQDHGGYFSPGLQQRGLLCLACRKISGFVTANGGNIFVIPAGNTIPEPVLEWMNTVVLPTWRAKAEEIREAQKPIVEDCQRRACETLGLPIDVEYKDIPEDKHEEWCKIWQELHANPDYRLPAGVSYPPIPPQMPEGITCYVLTLDDTWRKVSREETLDLTQPPDPIKVHHDKFFTEIFHGFANELGLDDIPREEIRNEYCGAENEPWFRFILGPNTITLGPRKRVYAIQINAPDGFHTEDLRKVVVDEYRSSYWANEDWQSEAEVATSLEVHAWTKEQLMRLLSIVGHESLKTAA